MQNQVFKHLIAKEKLKEKETILVNLRILYETFQCVTFLFHRVLNTPNGFHDKLVRPTSSREF